MKQINLDTVLLKQLCKLAMGVKTYDVANTEDIVKHLPIADDNNLKLKDFDIQYVGEFFERAEERGIEITDVRLVTMALFFGVWKNDFQEADFNDYQVTDFLNLLETRYPTIDNPLLEYAMFKIKEDTSYLDKIATNPNITIEDFYTILSFSREFDKADELDMELIANLQHLLETKDMVVGNNYFFFQGILRLSHAMSRRNNWNKKLKTINAYLKGIDGKLTQKGVIKSLSEFGFSLSNIEALNCLLKMTICESPLKKQKQVVQFLLYAANMETEYDEFEKSILNRIMELGDFSVKMEGGSVTSLSKALSYYDIFRKTKNANNFLFLANLAIDLGKYNANHLKIDILNDVDFKKKITGITSEQRNKFKLHILSKCIDDERLYKSEGFVSNMRTIVTKFEEAFDMHILDIWANGANPWSSQDCELERTYCTLCKYGVLNALENLISKKVNVRYSIQHFTEATDNDKVKAIDFFYKNDNDIAFKDMFYRLCRERNNSEKFYLEGTPDELKTCIDQIFEMTLIRSIDEFRNLLLNLMINNQSFVKEVYSEEEIQNLYHASLDLASTLKESTYGSSYYFFKQGVISDLTALYMSEEEKERVAEEKRAREVERKRQELIEKNQLVNEKLEAIRKQSEQDGCSYFGFFKRANRELSFDMCSTPAFKALKMKVVMKAECYLDEVEDFFELVGSMIKREEITLEMGKEIISNLSIATKETAVEAA